MRGAAQGTRDKELSRWFEGDDIGTMGLSHLARLVALGARRALRPGGSLVFFCDWRMVPVLAPALSSSGLRWVNLLVWDKGHMGMGHGFRHQHELALHFSKGGGVYHDKSCSNVIRASRVAKSSRRHPCEKPQDLITHIVRVVSAPGDLVVDPFAGSGAILEAAEALGRRALGADAFLEGSFQ